MENIGIVQYVKLLVHPVNGTDFERTFYGADAIDKARNVAINEYPKCLISLEIFTRLR